MVLHLAGSALAATPPFEYPTTTMNSAYSEGIAGMYAAKFVPGTLENCKTNSPSPSPAPGPSPSVTTHSCDIKGGQLEIDVAGTQKLVVIQSVMVIEYQPSSGAPNVSYHLQGVHGTSLPDGSPFESPASLSLNRHPQLATKMTGNLYAYNLGINGAIVMDWTPPPAP